MNFNLSGHYQNSSSPTEYKGGTIKNWSQISCTCGRRGGKWVIRTLQSLKGGSDKFFRDTNKILHPPRDKYWSVSNHNLCLHGIILSFVNNLEKLISNLTYISSLEFPQSGLKWRMLSCNWTFLFASTFEKKLWLHDPASSLGMTKKYIFLLFLCGTAKHYGECLYR